MGKPEQKRISDWMETQMEEDQKNIVNNVYFKMPSIVIRKQRENQKLKTTKMKYLPEVKFI